jgi:hypothetical protein
MYFDLPCILTHPPTHPEEADTDEHRRTVHWHASAHAPARESTFRDLPRKNFDQAFGVPVAAGPARIVQLLVERVDISPDGADIRLRTEGLTNMAEDFKTEREAA